LVLYFVIVFYTKGFQSLSIDKKVVHNKDEIVKIDINNLYIETQSCQDLPRLLFYKENNGILTQIYFEAKDLPFSCLNGKLTQFPMECDVVGSQIPKIKNNSSVVSWDLTYYEKEGETSVCDNSDSVVDFSGKIDRYIKREATNGKYVIKFGDAVKEVDLQFVVMH
jgi:hypothetical protein